MAEQQPPRPPRRELTGLQLLNLDMDAAHYGGSPLHKARPKKNLTASLRSKNDPKQLAQLAAVRGPTQFGGPGVRLCCGTTRRGTPCKKAAVRGFDVCLKHMSARQHAQHRQARRERGGPIDHAHILARRNMRNMLKENRLPRELLLQPAFRAVMRYVAPRWFGYEIRTDFDRGRMKDAALLSRELALAWFAGLDQGDWTPWHNVVSKVWASGFIQLGETP